MNDGVGRRETRAELVREVTVQLSQPSPRGFAPQLELPRACGRGRQRSRWALIGGLLVLVCGRQLSLRHGEVVRAMVPALYEKAREAQTADARHRLGVPWIARDHDQPD